MGGDELDEAIIAYMKRAYGSYWRKNRRRDQVYCGSAAPLDIEIKYGCRGRDATAGLPKTIHITSPEIHEEALKEVVSQIVDLVKNALDSAARAFRTLLRGHSSSRWWCSNSRFRSSDQ